MQTLEFNRELSMTGIEISITPLNRTQGEGVKALDACQVKPSRYTPWRRLAGEEIQLLPIFGVADTWA
jgi:hypothetical protein